MQRKIPTILGIFLTLVLVLGLALVTAQIQKMTKTFSRANQVLAPRNVGVGNVTDSSFTVYWVSDKEVAAVVFFGKTAELGMNAVADEGNQNTHFVRVSGLFPKTKYYFQINGDSQIREVTTGEKPTGPAEEPIYGKVLNSLGAPASGVIVVLDQVVAVSKNDGTFVLPVTATAKEDSSETVTLFTATDKAVINCKTGLDKPLPTVKLGETLNCGKSRPVSSGFKTASPSGRLTTNINDGETVSTTLPTISGRAGANQVVKIEVRSETPYSAAVKADPAGNWIWTPPADLAPGQHQVTITVTNTDGTTQTVTRTFYVAVGEQILPVTSGTPSATPPPPPPPPTPPPPVVVTNPPATGAVENSLLLLTGGVIFVTLGLWIIQRQS